MADQVGDGLAQGLVFLLVLEEKVQAVREVGLLSFREGDVLLKPLFLELDDLGQGLLKAAGAVPDDPLSLGKVVDLPRDFPDLLLQEGFLFQEAVVERCLLHILVVRPLDGPDILEKEADEPEEEHRQDDGEETNRETVDPCPFWFPIVFHRYSTSFARVSRDP